MERQNCDLDPNHWMSFSMFEAPRLSISVVLDAGAHDDFSGIQVMIVYDEEHDYLDGVDLKEDYLWCAHDSKENIRSALRNRKEEIRSSRQLVQNIIEAPAGTRPLCRIIFRLVRHPTSSSWCHLVLQNQYEWTNATRVAYNRITPCGPSSKYTTLRFLCPITAPRIRFLAPARIPPLGLHQHFRDSDTLSRACQIRIIPLHRRVRPAPLPKDVLWRIAEHYWDRTKQSLFAMGSVCKAWTPVLDMYFENIGVAGVDLSPPDVIARCLRMRPERGELIKSFDMLTLIDEYGSSSASPRDVLSIIRSIPYVRTLSLESLHGSLNIELLETLQYYQKIVSFDFSRRANAPAPNFTLDGIRELAMNWPNLRSLAIAGWAALPSSWFWDLLTALRPPFFHPRPRSDYPMSTNLCNLEQLSLSSGTIHDNQLLGFVPQTGSNLAQLNLYNVEVSNSELLAFLLRIGPSIKTIDFADLKISRGQDEGYALDIAIPHMTSLASASLLGDLISVAFIKNHRPHLRGVGSYPGLRVEDALGLRCADLPDAMGKTAWKSITLIGKGVGPPPTIPAVVRRIAQRRRITLDVYGYSIR